MKEIIKSNMWKEVFYSMLILGIATIIGLLFSNLGFTEANIITIYLLAILLASLVTTSRWCSLINSLACVLIFNFLFTEPRFTLHAYEKGYPVTFAIMFIASWITGTLAVRVKEHGKKAAEAELLAQKEQLRANLLRSISHDLRTPLTSISGNASNLLSNSKRFDEETKKQLMDASQNKELGEAFAENGGIPNFSQQMTVIGQTYEGIEIVEQLSQLETDDSQNGTYKIPKEDIMILSVTIDEYSAEENAAEESSDK